MKPAKAIILASGALIALSSINAHAKASDAGFMASATQSASNGKSAKAANKQLAKDVRRALSKSNGMSTGNITVKANGGAITLAGSVPDAAQLDRATQIAKGVNGVTSVRNALTIRSYGQ